MWALLDPPYLHFFHKKGWSESLAEWGVDFSDAAAAAAAAAGGGGNGNGNGSGEEDSGDSVGGDFSMGMMSMSMSVMNMSTTTVGGGGGGGSSSGSSSAGALAFSLPLNAIESCSVSASSPDRVDLVLSMSARGDGTDMKEVRPHCFDGRHYLGSVLCRLLLLLLLLHQRFVHLSAATITPNVLHPRPCRHLFLSDAGRLQSCGHWKLK